MVRTRGVRMRRGVIPEFRAAKYPGPRARLHARLARPLAPGSPRMRAPAGMTAEAQSAADFLSRRLGQKGGAREASRSSSIDPIDQCLVERDIEPHRPTGIGKQG